MSTDEIKPASPIDSTSAAPSAPRIAKGRGRLTRWLLRLGALSLLGLLGAELFLRYYIGLGDPPLSVASGG